MSSAPLHALPTATYRIENLGTGQLRLNDSIHDSADSIDWERTTEAFFDAFAPLCIEPYERVKKRADARIKVVDPRDLGGCCFERRMTPAWSSTIKIDLPASTRWILVHGPAAHIRARTESPMGQPGNRPRTDSG